MKEISQAFVETIQTLERQIAKLDAERERLVMRLEQVGKAYNYYKESLGVSSPAAKPSECPEPASEQSHPDRPQKSLAQSVRDAVSLFSVHESFTSRDVWKKMEGNHDYEKIRTSLVTTLVRLRNQGKLTVPERGRYKKTDKWANE